MSSVGYRLVCIVQFSIVWTFSAIDMQFGSCLNVWCCTCGFQQFFGNLHTTSQSAENLREREGIMPYLQKANVLIKHAHGVRMLPGITVLIKKPNSW